MSKDILVLVEGFSNIITIDFPWKGWSESVSDFFKSFLLDFLTLASSIIALSSLEVRSDMSKKFLTIGDKVKFTVKFKGREMQHVHLGRNLMDRIIKDTKDIGKVEVMPKFEGRQMIMIVLPN